MRKTRTIHTSLACLRGYPATAKINRDNLICPNYLNKILRQIFHPSPKFRILFLSRQTTKHKAVHISTDLPDPNVSVLREFRQNPNQLFCTNAEKHKGNKQLNLNIKSYLVPVVWLRIITHGVTQWTCPIPWKIWGDTQNCCLGGSEHHTPKMFSLWGLRI